MAGVRLHHPTFASCTLVVELPTPYPRPHDCASCGRAHERKAIHLRLDSAGDVIVAPEVLEKGRAQFTIAGFEIANAVSVPPPLFLGAVEQPKFETVEVKLNGNGQRFYRPGSNRYENRDRIYKPFQPIVDRELERRDRIATAETAKRRTIVPLTGSN